MTSRMVPNWKIQIYFFFWKKKKFVMNDLPAMITWVRQETGEEFSRKMVFSIKHKKVASNFWSSGWYLYHFLEYLDQERFNSMESTWKYASD